MARTVAGTLSLLVFAVCLTAGLLAGNSTATVLSNALLAMAVTFAVGLAVGAMARRMLDENLAALTADAAKPSAASSGESPAKTRGKK